MIHTEAWFRESSREGQDAVERLRRGDIGALADIWKLGKRGGLGVKPDFLVDIMTEKHDGKDFQWLSRMDDVQDAHASRVREDWIPYDDFPRAYNAFRRLMILQNISHHLANPAQNVPPTWFGNRDAIPSPDHLKEFWVTTDEIMGTLDLEWAEFQRKYPQVAALV